MKQKKRTLNGSKVEKLMVREIWGKTFLGKITCPSCKGLIEEASFVGGLYVLILGRGKIDFLACTKCATNYSHATEFHVEMH